VRGKSLSSRVFIEGAPGSAVNVCMVTTISADSSGIYSQVNVPSNQWVRVARTLSDPSDATTHGLLLWCVFDQATDWHGALYLDDVVIE
jgi:hypothetical protein